MLHLAPLLAALAAHDGPDPIGSWTLSSEQLTGTRLESVLGVAGTVEGRVEWVPDALGESLYFDGRTTRVLLGDDPAQRPQPLPVRHMTVEAWVAVNAPQPWGGILGVLQDNGGQETGWILGHDERGFSFGLASRGADDGDGLLTYMQGRRPFEPGRFHHVVATYDGETMRLYVDGALDANSSAQSGDLLYPDQAPLVIGGYLDANESYFLEGRIRTVRLFEQAASAEWVADAFAHGRALRADAPHVWIDPELRWVVHPYLQWATTDGMTVRWETSRPATTVVGFGTAVEWSGEGEARVGRLPERHEGREPAMLHELRLEGLEADTAYYYQARSVDSLGRELTSPILSFQTAPPPGVPFAFAVISDTQGNPEVNGTIARLAWGHRPSFVLHPGDLVDTGSVKAQWVDEFFGSMRPLLERVALFPALGNHEQDARLYYDQFSLPAPEHRYTFRYGDAQLFVVDSNREVGPGSEQHRWLARELGASRALWKVVVHHHPTWSSDENDYGDTWSGPSTRGDARVRALAALYDEHDVDLVWNGHIHSYERTWPLRAERAVGADEGTVYMITGGGGGSLETAGPIRPWFQNHVRRGHHFCTVAVNGPTLELRAFDLEGRLFDQLVIEKRARGR